MDGSPSRNTMNGILAKINDRAFQELAEYSPGEACMIITREVDRLDFDQLTTFVGSMLVQECASTGLSISQDIVDDARERVSKISDVKAACMLDERRADLKVIKSKEADQKVSRLTQELDEAEKFKQNLNKNSVKENKNCEDVDIFTGKLPQTPDEQRAMLKELSAIKEMRKQAHVLEAQRAKLAREHDFKNYSEAKKIVKNIKDKKNWAKISADVCKVEALEAIEKLMVQKKKHEETIRDAVKSLSFLTAYVNITEANTSNQEKVLNDAESFFDQVYMSMEKDSSLSVDRAMKDATISFLTAKILPTQLLIGNVEDFDMSTEDSAETIVEESVEEDEIFSISTSSMTRVDSPGISGVVLPRSFSPVSISISPVSTSPLQIARQQIFERSYQRDEKEKEENEKRRQMREANRYSQRNNTRNNVFARKKSYSVGDYSQIC